MTKQNKYRILCTLDDVFTVQERAEQEGDSCRWNTVHVCKEKGEAGLNEARQWIDTEGGREMPMIKTTTNMKGFQRWMMEHPRKRVDGYFNLGDREMTHEEIKKMVDYAVLMGYRTEADIPENELAKVLGLKGGEE